MIREPEWEDVRKKLDSYALWTDGESLEFILGRRAFERKSPDYSAEIEGYSLKEIVGQVFCIYFDEMKSDPSDATEELYDRFVGPAATTAMGALNALLTATEKIPRKTLATAAQNLIKGLERFEGDLRQAWIKEFRKALGGTGPAMDVLGVDGARERLILSLWDYLTDLTNLTKEDKIRHITHLLDHFQIRSYKKPNSGASYTSIDKLIHSEQRNQSHRQAMTHQWRTTGQIAPS